MKKWIKLVVIAWAILLGGLLVAPTVQAVSQEWEKPTFAYGDGMNQSELDQTYKLLDIKDTASVTQTAVSGDDVKKYLGYSLGNATMISSVLVDKTEKGTGVQVDIVTPQNVLKITPEQYMNAAITAGVTDVNIKVAAPREVTGESALTGVYKALELNGEVLETERMQVAQEELITTSKIAGNLDDKQATSLDAAIVDIKQQLSELVKNSDNLASVEDIERIVSEALQKYNLKDIISAEQINSLVIFFNNFQQTGAIDSEELKQQLSQLASDLGGQVQEVWNKAEESGLIDRIINFFRDLFNSIFGGIVITL